MRRRWVCNVLVVCGLSFSGWAMDVSGTISEDTRWAAGDSPVNQTGDLTVAATATLTIEPGVVFNVQATRRLTVEGALAATESTFTFNSGADVVIDGQAVFTSCEFNGFAALMNSEDLIFSETSSGNLTDCTLHDLNLMISTQAFEMVNGSAENTFGPAVYLNMTALSSPVITGVDFSADTDWLSVSSMTWFAQEINGSLSTNITNNLFAETGLITVGAGTLDGLFHFTQALPFSGATRCQWTWGGGTIASASSVFIDPQAEVFINGDLSVAGQMEIAGGAVLKTSHALSLSGELIINGGGQYQFAGSSASADITGELLVQSQGEARLAGTSKVSGNVTVAENALLSLNTMTVTSSGELSLRAGAVLEIGYKGLTVEGAWSASDATIQLGSSGGLDVSGTAALLRCGFSFHPLSVISVQDGGSFTASQCGFTGAHDPDDVDGLIFEAGGGGGLSNCILTNFRLSLESPAVSISGGAIDNADGPALTLTQTAGDAPAVSGVDFSGDPGWLFVANPDWLFQEWDVSLPAQFTENVYSAQAEITLGRANIGNDVTLAVTLPFSGATHYTWRWLGGTVVPGVALTVPGGASLTVSGPIIVAGELLVEPGGFVEMEDTSAISGLMHVWGNEAKAEAPQVHFLGDVTIQGTMQVETHGLIETNALTVDRGGWLGLETGGQVNIELSGITVQPQGTLEATDATVKFVGSGRIYVYGTARLARSLVDVFNYNDVEVYGVFIASQSTFEGAYPTNADSLIFHPGGNGQFDLCKIFDMTVEVAGRSTFDRCVFTNRDGAGLIVSTGALAAISRSNLLTFGADAIQSASGTDVNAARCYWGAADGPSGAGYSGAGVSITGIVTVSDPMPEALVFAPVQVLSHIPSGLVTTPVQSLDITFSSMVDPDSFNWADIVLVGPEGEFYASSVIQQGLHVWRIDFPEKSAEGNYYFRAGPLIQNMAGFGLDQNGDGVTGDPVLDVYAGSFTIGYPPSAEFTYSETAICVGNAVTFTDQSTNTPTSITWDFGDGTTDTGASVSHIYEEKGVYSATLTVENAYGQDSLTRTGLVQVEELPSADLYADVTSGNAPMAVNFSNLTEGNVDAWFWDFGDGQTSTVAGPGGHIYDDPGAYTVLLRATNRCGFTTDEVVIQVNAVEPPAAPTELTASDGTDCQVVLLTWLPSDTAMHYVVYRDGDAVSGQVFLTSYTDYSVQPGMVHTYSVRAYNLIGPSVMSSTDTGFRGVPGQPPATVTATDGALAHAIRITWSAAPAGALNYRVYRNTTDSASGASAVTDWLPLETLSFEDVNVEAPVLIPGQGCNGKDTIQYAYYYYWVTAMYSCGESRKGEPDSGYRSMNQKK